MIAQLSRVGKSSAKKAGGVHAIASSSRNTDESPSSSFSTAVAVTAGDAPPLELLPSSCPRAGAATAARSNRNADVSSVGSTQAAGGGVGDQLRAAAACRRTPDEATTGNPVTSCTMRRKLAGSAMM
jgi:hypothetical protein